MKRKKNTLIAVLILLSLLLTALALTVIYRVWERPPERKEYVQHSAEAELLPSSEPAEETPAPTPTPEPLPEGNPIETERQNGVYTILLGGIDKVSESIDVIIVGRIDTEKHEMNFVSIPRDSIINVDWPIRKINAVYAGSRNFGGTGIDALMMHVRRYIGFTPDCYAILDLDTFIEVIDELGGVDFDVPYPIAYYFDDIEMRLLIVLEPGYQHLDGRQAMAVCRYRNSEYGEDMGRIEVQHDFLHSCAEQFITLGSIPHAPKIVKILAEHLNTDLSAANIAWFLRQALACKSEDIMFYTMPADRCLLQGYSYVLPKVWEWLDMINEKLSPFDTEIGAGSLDVVYYEWPSTYRSTSGGLDGDWYYPK